MRLASRSLAVLLLLAGGGFFFLWQKPPPEAPRTEPRPVPVRTVQVAREDVSELTRALGHVRSLSHVVIRPQIDGQLVEMRAKEGQTVSRGDLLARIDDRAIVAELEQAEAQLAMSRARLSAARRDLLRYQTLSERQAVSAQAIDQQQAQVEQLSAEVQAREATVSAERVRLSHTRLLAPTDGVVGLRGVDAGNYLRANDASGLFSISRLQPISIEVALPQTHLGTLRSLIADPNGAPVRAYAREGGELLAEGRLVAIDNQVDGGTIRVRAEFDNQDGRLWPGQFVAVTLRSALRRDALTLPATAMQRGLDGAFVYRVRDGRAERVSVSVVYQGDGIVVVNGLEPGDEVVFDGYSRISSGTVVSPELSMPAAGASTSTARAGASSG